ncbi:hypothetical protein Vi05172_g3685 [Venturia inaequalis]|nr:hypothetical protein Vi05172_g3685 [Venturia inaequalis]
MDMVLEQEYRTGTDHGIMYIVHGWTSGSEPQ